MSVLLPPPHREGEGGEERNVECTREMSVPRGQGRRAGQRSDCHEPTRALQNPEVRLLPQTGAAVLQRGRHARRAARWWRKVVGTWPGKLRESYTGNLERLPGKAGDKASVRVKRGKEVY